MQRIIRYLDKLGAEDLTPRHVRTATLVRLPFRLCTGTIAQIRDPDSDRLDLWLRNRVFVQHDADIEEVWLTPGLQEVLHSSAEHLLTDVVAIDREPDLQPGEFEGLVAGKPGPIRLASLECAGLRLLNEVIGAYQSVRLGPYSSARGLAWPRMLTFREAFERIPVQVVLFCDPERAIDGQAVLRLCDHLDGLPLGLGSGWTGDIRDLSPDQMAAMESAVPKLRKHVFYELRANAVSAMLSGDAIVAIVLACAALEGAHGAFVRLALRSKVPGGVAQFNRFMDGLLREQGFYSLVQLSVRAFMEEGERPSEDDLQKCLHGVTIRNAIMHAGIRGTGRYKLREYTASELSAGYRGIMAVYRAFAAAVDAREGCNP